MYGNEGMYGGGDREGMYGGGRGGEGMYGEGGMYGGGMMGEGMYGGEGMGEGMYGGGGEGMYGRGGEGMGFGMGYSGGYGRLRSDGAGVGQINLGSFQYNAKAPYLLLCFFLTIWAVSICFLWNFHDLKRKCLFLKLVKGNFKWSHQESNMKTT